MGERTERDLRVGDLSADGAHYWDGDLWKWQPLWLRPDEVIEAARRCYQFPAGAATYLSDGLLNQSWRLESTSETRVLRVSRSDRSREQIESEHAFTTALGQHLRFVVVPLPGIGGRTIQEQHGRFLSLSPFISGASATAIAPEDRGREAAWALAQIHRVSLEHIDLPQRQGFSSADEQPRWIWPSIRPVLSRELARTDERDELFAIFDREMKGLDSWLDGLHGSRRLLRRTTIHGDYNPRNMIFRDRRIAAVIDWDNCHIDAAVREVAASSFSGIGVSPATFWRTYLDSGGPLDASDIDLLGGFARIDAFSELQWAVHDGRVIPTQALGLLRDLAAHLDRLHELEPEL